MNEMKLLYSQAWKEMIRLRATIANVLEPSMTPVIFFGNWQSAKVVTAGLNPSEIEFKENGSELDIANRRFLHFSEVNNSLDDCHIKSAFDRAENYFSRNPYRVWFNHYNSFFVPSSINFNNGLACHTDYITPFTTITGIGDFSNELVNNYLLQFGLDIWKRTILLMPEVKVIMGHGRGHNHMPKLFQFDSWEEKELPFQKEIRNYPKPLLYKKLVLENGKEVEIYWWKPNRGIPFTYLTNDEKEKIGAMVFSKY